MGFASEIRSAAAASHLTLARLQGLADDGAGNLLFSGQAEPVTGVFSRTTVQWIPQPGGGYRKKTSQVFSIVRTAMEKPPLPNTKAARIDVSPAVHYAVEMVNTGNPLAWEVHLNRFDA